MNPAVFAHYARYYDLLYRDKDYAAEARLVDGWLRGAGVRGGTLLDIGCGSGAHARQFAQLGWTVTGVDLSPAMIGIAQARQPAGLVGSEFLVGAAEEFALGRTVDAAVSLFHVASYQSAPGAALRMLTNVRRHLRPGGRFIFDFWHGPGVLADPPTVRVRRVEDERIKVTRISEPVHRRDENIVEVGYEVFIEDRQQNGHIERLNETHRMRYFSLSELTGWLATAGFSLEHARAGLTEEPLHDRAWYGLVEARAV